MARAARDSKQSLGGPDAAVTTPHSRQQRQMLLASGRVFRGVIHQSWIQLGKGNRLSKLSAARAALSRRGTAVVVEGFDA